MKEGSRDEVPARKGIIVSTQSLGEQTVDLLARLVRLGCVNDLTADSGGEERAADLLEDFFAGLPISIERITPHPGRTTLVVTVEGSDPRSAGAPLTLLGHTDVVPVDTAKWTRDPFGAQIEDDVMWGRGTVDMLHLTAAMAVVTREVARRADEQIEWAREQDVAARARLAGADTVGPGESLEEAHAGADRASRDAREARERENEARLALRTLEEQ